MMHPFSYLYIKPYRHQHTIYFIREVQPLCNGYITPVPERYSLCATVASPLYLRGIALCNGYITSVPVRYSLCATVASPLYLRGTELCQALQMIVLSCMILYVYM